MKSPMEGLSAGEYIRQLRIEKGLSQKDVAKQLGIDFTLVSKIELSERNLSLDLVPALAKVLGKDFRSLQIDLIAIKVAEDYRNEEYASEGLRKAVEQLK